MVNTKQFRKKTMCINKIKYFRKLILCGAPAMRQDSRTKENINRAPAGRVVTILTSQEVYWKKIRNY